MYDECRDEVYDEFEDDHYYGYCQDCEQYVETVREDQGIGSYEYWGTIGTHHDYQEVCPHCGGYVEEGRPEDDCDE